MRQQLLGNTIIRDPDLVTLEVIRSQTPSLQTSSTVGVKSRRALFGQIGLEIRSSDFGFYRSQMISVKREILIDDDSLRLNAMQGHGLEDADMLICLRVNGDLVENAELSKVNQPQIPQAYQCNLLETCCYTSGRSWHANPFPNPNCNKLGKNSNVSLSVKHVLNKI